MRRWWETLITDAWSPVVRWVEMRVLGSTSPQPPLPYLSSTYALINIFCLAVIAAVAAGMWSYLDRRRPNYITPNEWVRAYLRFWAGALLVDYGIEKVLLQQMGRSPTPFELLTPPAHLHPQRLLWVFMGASPVYQIFAGLTEAVAGILLMFRRTMRVGALIAVAAISNVVVLNWSYHVGVLIISGQILAATLFLAVPDLRRLAKLLVLRRPVATPQQYPLLADPRWDRGARVIGILFATWLIGASSFYWYRQSTRSLPPLYGAYDVETFVRNDTIIPPLVTDSTRWRRLTVDFRWNRSVDGAGSIISMQDTVLLPFLFRIDTLSSALTFISLRDSTRQARWSYLRQDSNHLVLTGPDLARLLRGRGPAGAIRDSVQVTLRRRDLSATPLLRPRPQWQ
jgi:uncharacterized membrane protein YphA (DoxX/SURF4 family)